MKGYSTTSKIGVICFWILLWQGTAVFIGSPLLLASPIAVCGRLVGMITTSSFWIIIGNSALRILSGFALALIIGTALAVVAHRFKLVHLLISPLLSVIKAVPVASFIVLVLLWVSSAYLSTVVGFLIVLPIVFENIYSALLGMDKELIEMAQVLGVPLSRRIKYLYLEQLRPGFQTAVGVGVGFCFKSGVAAEVIGICKNTIGEAIYTAKLSFETADVLAWTVVIVTLSVLTGKVARMMVARVGKGEQL